MSENERIVCEFLRKIAPSRNWEYLGEVEHYWIGELCDELNEQLKAENAKLTKLARWMYQVMDESCAVHYPYEPAPVSMQALMRAEKELQALGIEVDE